jgi:thioredoxin 1
VLEQLMGLVSARKRMSNTDLTNVNDANFDAEVRRSRLPVVIDFWAPWCQPCRAVHPILERMASKYSGSVRILRMNVDDEKHTPAEYAVRGIPTLLFFKNGTIKNQLVGAQSEENIEQAIRNLL